MTDERQEQDEMGRSPESLLAWMRDVAIVNDAQQEPRKAFRITSGKGFHITFQNGYTVSVQWGWGNYCENRNKPMPSLDDLREGRKSPEGEAGSMDAEVAVWHRDGDLLRLNGWDDTVKGWQTPADVLALLNWAASQPDAKPAALSHETDGGPRFTEEEIALVNELRVEEEGIATAGQLYGDKVREQSQQRTVALDAIASKMRGQTATVLDLEAEIRELQDRLATASHLSESGPGKTR